MDSNFDFILQAAGDREYYQVAGDEESVAGFVNAFLPLFEEYTPDTQQVEALQHYTDNIFRYLECLAPR